jgi:hypothetical protein
LKALRRGWFLGGEEFLERLEGVVKGALGEKKRESFDGEAVSRHDEMEAERLLQAGMRALGVAGIKEVKRLRKNDKRKQALVWLVKSRKAVRLSGMNGFLSDWRWGTVAMSLARWLDFEMGETGKQEHSKQK